MVKERGAKYKTNPISKKGNNPISNFWTGESFLDQAVNTNAYNSALSKRSLNLLVQILLT